MWTNNIRRKRENITVILQMVIIGEQLHTNTLDNLGKMVNFCERYKLSKIIQEEEDHLNSPIYIIEIEFIVILFHEETSGADGFTGEFYWTFEEKFQFFRNTSKNLGGRNTFELFLWGQNDDDTESR